MLSRFLYDPSGRVRVRRMIPVVGVCLAFAIFGSFLLVLTPMLSEHEGVRTLWVLFSIFLLKFPLIALLSWFILRHFEWPVKPPKWSDPEAREILAYLLAEADRVQGRPDAAARLAYLQREAWNVADRVGGDVKIDAVDVAVRIDGMAARRRARRPAR
ncbi:hypothetical protein [Miltoncostaea marina]|uniref:hypothetical protein n=1 Tax=Miltoncostaea marina TaxID=2843215 RepID=UPI001C3C8178|nr:hypothetical protein [Miltoncostaea marina]